MKRRSVLVTGLAAVAAPASARPAPCTARLQVGADFALMESGPGADRRRRARGTPVSVSANDGSGTRVAEQAAWRRAGLSPQAPWYRTAAAPDGLIAEARAVRAHALVERAAWTARGGSPLGILARGDAALVEPVHAMRSFRSPHPAGKLFLRWIAGPRGRAVVVARRDYRAGAA
jgi:hypothetical protein